MSDRDSTRNDGGNPRKTMVRLLTEARCDGYRRACVDAAALIARVVHEPIVRAALVRQLEKMVAASDREVQS